MIDVPSVLTKLVHNKAQIPNMVNWCDIDVAYPNGDVMKLFQLLMSSEDNKFCFFFIELEHVTSHPLSNLIHTPLHQMNTVILSRLDSCRIWFKTKIELLVISIKMIMDLAGAELTEQGCVESEKNLS